MKFLEVMFLFFILNQDIFKRGRCKLRRLRIGAPEDSGIFHFAYGQKYQVSFKYSQLNHLCKACRISPLINCGLPWLQRIQSKCGAFGGMILNSATNKRVGEFTQRIEKMHKKAPFSFVHNNQSNKPKQLVCPTKQQV